MSIKFKLFIILLLILLSAFFSMAEISLAAARKIKLQLLAEEGSAKAEKVLELQKNPGNFFTTVQIGLNMVALLAGIVGDGILSPILSKYIESQSVVFLISFIFVTAAFIEFSDLIPKRFALVYPEATAVALVDAMAITMKVLTPILLIFNGFANLFFKIFKLPTTRDDMITHEDIFAIVDAGAEAGVVHSKEHHLIENVFELEQRWVSSAMTPRDEVIYFNLDESEESIKDKIANNPHSKFLVCEDDIDSIYGYVDSKNILSRVLKGELSGLQNIKEIINRDILIVPNTLTLSDMLDRFNETKEDFSVILNEYAHVVGIITLNDVISRLMSDVVHPMQEESITKRNENSWLIDGSTPIEDVRKVLDIASFPEEDSYETIAGFIIYMLKDIPKKGDLVEYENFTFEIVDVDSFKIDQLLVIRRNEEDREE